MNVCVERVELAAVVTQRTILLAGMVELPLKVEATEAVVIEAEEEAAVNAH